MEKFVTENLFILGDTHSLRFEYLLRLHTLENFILIHVGDCGAGFEHTMVEVRYLDHIQKYCEKHNGRVFFTRGNHDDPECWKLDHTFNKIFDRLEFVPDYTYKSINNNIFLFAGGAISIDRKFRTQGKDYWKDEVFVLPDDYETLPQCDVLITHSAGIHQPPYDGLTRIQDFFIKDAHLPDELIEERKLIEKLYYQVLPRKAHYWGHFHYPQNEFVNNTHWRCLNIDELADITRILL